MLYFLLVTLCLGEGQKSKDSVTHGLAATLAQNFEKYEV